MPIHYRVDGGPMAVNPSGTVIIDNATGIQRVQNMFQVWQDVPTASIAFQNNGPIQSVPGFTDGDVSTLAEFDAVENSCFQGTQNPIMFDANGSFINALIGDPGVIGFASICAVNFSTGFVVSAEAVLNGRFQDHIDSGSNFELTAAQFDQAFVHEFGHFSGLDHSQINSEVLGQAPNCDLDDNAGLPVMFPILACDARVTDGLPALAPDDLAWISKLYPETVNSPPTQVLFSSMYTLIPGHIFFSDGSTQAQGVNVIARLVDDSNTTPNESRRVAMSVVSGYRFTGNPGQSVTQGYLPCSPASACPTGLDDNTGGDLAGSRDPDLIGLYEIPVPAGTYTVQTESINPGFVAGSSVGPLNPPIASPGPNEFWNIGESNSDSTSAFDTIDVTVGASIATKDIILNDTAPTFDSLESARLWVPAPEPPGLRERLLGAAEVRA